MLESSSAVLSSKQPVSLSAGEQRERLAAQLSRLLLVLTLASWLKGSPASSCSLPRTSNVVHRPHHGSRRQLLPLAGSALAGPALRPCRRRGQGQEGAGSLEQCASRSRSSRSLTSGRWTWRAGLDPHQLDGERAVSGPTGMGS